MRQWRQVKGYEGLYEVSCDGCVRVVKTGLIRKQHLNGTGRYKLTLYKNGCKKNVYVHRLVAEAFHPDADHNLTVDHLDGDYTNNHYKNLDFCTQDENVMRHHNKSIKYKNVYYCKTKDRYIVRYRKGGEVHYIGTYKCKEKAREAAKCLII